MVSPQVRHLLIVFVLALAVRLFYFAELIHFPLADAPVMDALYHHEWAQKLAHGEDWPGAYFRAPAYPYLVGFIYKLFGVKLWVPRLLQLILGAFSCIAVTLIARELFDEKVSFVSGLVAALYGPLIFFEGELLVETLMVPAALWGLLLLLRTRLFLSGLLLGLAAITRPNILLFIIAAPGLLLLQHGAARAWRYLLPLLGAALFIGPVFLRNLTIGGDRVLIASQGGVNFYIGNNPLTDGVTAVVPGTNATWWGGYNDTIRIAEQAAGRSLKPSEVSDYWFGRGFEFIRTSPITWLKLMFKKTYLFWQGFEPPNNEDLYAFSGFSRLLRFLVWKTNWFFFPFGLVSPLALCGLGLSLRIYRKHILPVGFISLYALSVILFFVCARFRVPVLPLLIPYAVFFVQALWRGIRAREFAVSGYVLALIGLVVILNADFFNLGTRDQGDTEHTLGNYYLEKKQYARALDYFQKAREKAPHRPDIINNIGNVYLDTGRLEEAFQSYRQALEKNPRHEASIYNLGVMYLRTGQLDLAITMFLNALDVTPSDDQARAGLAQASQAFEQLATNRLKDGKIVTESSPNFAQPFYQLGRAYYVLRDVDRSLAAYAKATEICPSFGEAWNDRGNVLNQLGRREEAKVSYRRAIQENPQFIAAYHNLIRLLQSEGQATEADTYTKKLNSLPAQ